MVQCLLFSLLFEGFKRTGKAPSCQATSRLFEGFAQGSIFRFIWLKLRLFEIVRKNLIYIINSLRFLKIQKRTFYNLTSFQWLASTNKKIFILFRVPISISFFLVYLWSVVYSASAYIFKCIFAIIHCNKSKCQKLQLICQLILIREKMLAFLISFFFFFCRKHLFFIFVITAILTKLDFLKIGITLKINILHSS